MEGGSDGVGYDLLHLHDYVSLHVDVQLWESCCQVLLKLLVAQLVGRLKPAILVRILLHCVIYQVGKLVSQVKMTEFFGSGSNVSISVKVGFGQPIVASH